MWRVVFDSSSAVLIPVSEAPTDETAKLQAKLKMWVLTGNWLPVERVELIVV